MVLSNGYESVSVRTVTLSLMAHKGHCHGQSEQPLLEWSNSKVIPTTITVRENSDLAGFGVLGLCCRTRLRDSCCESSVVAGCYEQLGPDDIQDQELVAI